MHPVRRIKVALLLLGAVAGYASGIVCMRERAHSRHAAFERHVADVCTAAAARAAR
jgi:hypothetical protein